MARKTELQSTSAAGTELVPVFVDGLTNRNQQIDLDNLATFTHQKAYESPFYNDHRILLTGINPVGPATAPTQDPNGEGWLFAAAADNVAVLVTQMPHDWKEGTIITPHIHWQKTSDAAGDVQWKLEYDISSPGGDFSGSYTEVDTVNAPVAGTVDNDTAVRHLITSFGDLDLTGETLSAIIKFKISRLGSSGGASDDYAANALALSFDFHYQLDRPGSRQEFTK